MVSNGKDLLPGQRVIDAGWQSRNRQKVDRLAEAQRGESPSMLGIDDEVSREDMPRFQRDYRLGVHPGYGQSF